MFYIVWRTKEAILSFFNHINGVGNCSSGISGT
jgi:hypothetical protein